jgi:ParB-like chromosome segregation protein Spo0J
MLKEKSTQGGLGGGLQIERRSVHDLSNDPANARKHNDKNIDAIISSLRRFGQQKPIVIDQNNIVRAGNGTLEAARRLQWESIDCVVTSLNGSDAIAYAIADNRTAELAEWDESTLAAQLNGLLSESEEIALAAGFTPEEIEELNAIENGEGSDTEKKLEQSLQLEPGIEYLIVTFKDEAEFEEAKEKLNLQLVRRGGYKAGSPFEAVSTERVLNWERLRGVIK